LFDWREINRTGWLDLRTSCVQARWIYCPNYPPFRLSEQFTSFNYWYA